MTEPETKPASILSHPIFEFLILGMMIFLASQAGLFSPSVDALHLRPTPDAAEHAWIASAFANDHPFAFPVVNEIHPSRFSVVHGFFASWPLWLSGGDLRSLQYWSVFAAMAGFLILYFWMRLTGIHPAVRLLAFGILLGNQMSFDILRNILQEPSLVLLFSISFISFTFWQRREGRFFDLKALLLLTACGAACAAMTAIRMTLAPVLILFLGSVFIRWVLEKEKSDIKNWLQVLLALLGAFVVIVLLAVWGQRANSGLFNVVGYHHWIPNPETSLFRWSDPFQGPINSPKDMDMPNLLFNQLMGFNGTLHPFGNFFGYAILAGFITGLYLSVVNIISAYRKKSDLKPESLEILILGGLSIGQYLVHSVYSFYALRFFCVIFPGFLLVGIWGLHWLIVNGWKARPTKSFRFQMIGSIVLVFIGIGLAMKKQIPYYIRDAGIKANYGDKLTDVYEILPELKEGLQGLEGPLYISSLPTLNTRLLLGMQDFPYPIVQIVQTEELFQDGHIPQFESGEVSPALGELDSRVEWPSPEDSWVFRFGDMNDEEYEVQQNKSFVIMKDEYFQNVAEIYPETAFLFYSDLNYLMEKILKELYGEVPFTIEQHEYNKTMTLFRVKKTKVGLGPVLDN